MDGQTGWTDGQTVLSTIVVGAFDIVTFIVNNSLHSATEVRATLADLFWRGQSWTVSLIALLNC